MFADAKETVIQHNDGSLVQIGNDSKCALVSPHLLNEHLVCCFDDDKNDGNYKKSVLGEVDSNTTTTKDHWTTGRGGHNEDDWNAHFNNRRNSQQELLADATKNLKTHLRQNQQSPPSKRRKIHDCITMLNPSKRNLFGDAPWMALNNIHKGEEDFCDLPYVLQAILVEERAKITCSSWEESGAGCTHPNEKKYLRPARYLHTLPAKVSVFQILQHYEKKRNHKTQNKMQKDQLRKFCKAVENLFDSALETHLLHPQERPQFKALHHQHFDLLKKNNNDKRPCEIYGCEFLLRLLARLPDILSMRVDQSHWKCIDPMRVNDLTILLLKNRQVCFQASSFRKPTYDELLDYEKDLLMTGNRSLDVPLNQSMDKLWDQRAHFTKSGRCHAPKSPDVRAMES